MKTSYHTHKKEKLGLVLFLIVGVVGAGMLYFLPRWLWPHKKELLEVSLNKKQLPEEDHVEKTTQKQTNGFTKETAISVAKNSINPNKATVKDWMSLGLSEKQANVIINYANKGGQFYNEADLRKIYSLSEHHVDRMLPYLSFEEKPIKDKTSKKIENISSKVEEHNEISINETDAETLQKIKGIGPVLSNRIIQFRDQLGGFHDKEQLREVYNLPDSVADVLLKKIILQSANIKKININTATSDELYKHPYLRPYRKEIIDIRKKEGNFKDLEDLKRKLLINDEKYRKIAPYLAL